MPQVQICRGFGHKDYERLSSRFKDGVVQPDEAARRRAVRIFARRMRERFFSCIRALERADSRLEPIEIPDDPNPDRPVPDEQAVTPGFAIMGLCCLLVETLTLFLSLEGKTDKERFIRFLQLPSFKESFSDPDLAQAFWDGVRNGILHEAETRKWLIWRDRPEGQMVDKRNELFILNRTLFLAALRREYAGYLRVLRSQQEIALKTTFVKRMNQIVKRVAKLP